MFNACSVCTISPALTIKSNPAGTICEVFVPFEFTITTFDSPFSDVVISVICPACVAPKTFTLLFSPVG
jgi:hypothetical protein